MQHHFCPSRFPPIPEGGAAGFDGKIIIVGAGASGLFAALSLQRMGVQDFMVLEASDHIGGRLRATPDEFTSAVGGQEFDVGAEWIHSTDGARVLASMMEDLADDIDETTTELIPYQPTWHFRSRKSRVMTALYRETKFKTSTWHGWLKKHVYDKVKDRVELKTPVEDIIYKQDGKVKVKLANGGTREADRVICTASLAVLKHSIEGELLRFDPPLPEEKQNAIRALDMPPGFRILFHMKENFYNEVTLWSSFCNLLSDPNDVALIYDAALGKSHIDNNVLAFVAIGNKNAGQFSDQGNTELAEAALRRIDELFDGKGSANLIGEPIVQDWTKEPYIRGAYSFPGPAKYRVSLGKPEGGGRIIFAGEHTSKKHFSLVPGAAYEGRRAALEAVTPLGNM